MLDYALLAALAAVIRTGSFERAAQHLNVTPSAISQRIKLLEERLGTVLVVRGQPCTATEVGQRLCQHVEQVALLALKRWSGKRLLLRLWKPSKLPATALRKAKARPVV
jgi:hypothetical protein